jgi:stage II sporulation protein D
MSAKILLFYSLLFCLPVNSQVNIRLFTGQRPETIIFSVRNGIYALTHHKGDSVTIDSNTPVLLTRINGKLAVKVRNSQGFFADSVLIRGTTGNDSFSLITENGATARRQYEGSLKCKADLNTILIINVIEPEKYIAGVVRAEGGTGKNIEFFKTQAVLARTYLYKYMNKHSLDGYNLCDATHCQAYYGMSGDPVINKASLETAGEVVLGHDSILIISAFHSNCGGQTASSEDVWLAHVDYLKSVKDPYCLSSPNATWRKSFPAKEWVDMIHQLSHNDAPVTPAETRFSQDSRSAYYKAGTISVPLGTIRSSLGLRSSFFSVVPEGNNVVLKGRGYGHGVGLCQEGAMMMAVKGFTYERIISFYFRDVFISDISMAVPETLIR